VRAEGASRASPSCALLRSRVRCRYSQFRTPALRSALPPAVLGSAASAASPRAPPRRGGRARAASAGARALPRCLSSSCRRIWPPMSSAPWPSPRHAAGAAGARHAAGAHPGGMRCPCSGGFAVVLDQQHARAGADRGGAAGADRARARAPEPRRRDAAAAVRGAAQRRSHRARAQRRPRGCQLHQR
jgi:hypothetical protein